MSTLLSLSSLVLLLLCLAGHQQEGPHLSLVLLKVFFALKGFFLNTGQALGFRKVFSYSQYETSFGPGGEAEASLLHCQLHSFLGDCRLAGVLAGVEAVLACLVVTPTVPVYVWLIELFFIGL